MIGTGTLKKASFVFDDQNDQTQKSDARPLSVF
jgi:hypothetical protein